MFISEHFEQKRKRQTPIMISSPREQVTVKSILDYLRVAGHFCFRNNTGAFNASYNGKSRFHRYGCTGSGDILGVKRPTGQFFSIEVKRRGKKPTDKQIAFMESVISAGGLAFVAYSVDDVIAAGL